MDKYTCIVVKNGRVENVQIGDENYTFNHLKNTASQYINEKGVSQVVIVKQDSKNDTEIMYEWTPE